MKIKLDDELEEKVREITDVDYRGLLDFKDIESIIKDLIIAYEDVKYELKEKEEYCEEYHINRDIDYYEEYGISRNDF